MNKVERLEEFNELLKDYEPAKDVIELANKANLVLFAGVSSSGRNTIIKELIDQDDFHYIISDTTRKPRENNGELERDGVNYHFRTEEEFLQRLKDRRYLEAAIIHGQQVSGISVEELETVATNKQIGITDMETVGSKIVMKSVPKALGLFLIPPTFEEWMKRLTLRGGMDQEEIRRRLESAEREIEDVLKNQQFSIVINIDYQEAANEVAEIAKRRIKTADKIKADNDTAWKLLNELKRDLNS